MNNSLEALKEIYKPFRYTLNKKAIILETSSGNFVVKEKPDIDIKNLYTYLISRDFDNYVPLIDENRTDVNVYQYVDDISMPVEQKAMDMINVVANLHNKTTYFKEVTEDTYKEIFETVSSNINYIKEKYNKLFNEIEGEIYMSPSHYLLIRNSSKIVAAISFCESELENWYELVKDTRKQRVALIHNNLELDHFKKGDRSVLISWEKSKIDSPILDLINFYQKEYLNISFDEVFKQYCQRYPLDESEKKLFFIITSIPKDIELTNHEFSNCKKIREILDYIYKTESLARPYYTEDKIEE